MIVKNYVILTIYKIITHGEERRNYIDEQRKN